MTTLPNIPPSTHFKQLQTLLLKGYTSQLLFCQELPPTIKIPALISCRMYDQAASVILNQDSQSPLHLLWLIVCSHITSMNYDDAYELLSKDKEIKYKQMADEWIKMKKPLLHPPQVKALLRTKFQHLLHQGQEQNYFSNQNMPIFLISTIWLQKLYNDNFPYIPAVDNENLYEPMPWIQSDPQCMHYNYALKSQCKENIDYKIIPYEAWHFLLQNFGGMQFRRFTTSEKQPICELTYQRIKIMIVQQRHLFGFQIFQILVSRFDTIAFIKERLKRIMITYTLMQFQSLKCDWQPILISQLPHEEFIEIIQDCERDLVKQAEKGVFTLQRLEMDHDVEDSQFSQKSDILLFNLVKDKKSFIDIHSIPIKKTTKKYNKCLTCSTTQKLQECICKQVHFCSPTCREKNKEHLKNCDNLRKEEYVIANLIDTYNTNKRKLNFAEIKNGGKVGLENLGNTCYMNAALQCILTVEDLGQYFAGNQHVQHLNTSNVLGSRGQLACAFSELIKDYYTTNKRALQPLKVRKIISSSNSLFRGMNHQDSQQFLNYFLDKLHEDLNTVKNKPYVENIESDGRPDSVVSDLSWANYLKRNDSFISTNFAGQYRSEIRCPDCSRISITFDPFISVTLPFPKLDTRIEILGYFLSKDGGFQKISIEVNENMNSQQFLNKYFKQPVQPILLQNKKPVKQWNYKKEVKSNKSPQGVLMFYPKPDNSKVEVHVSFEGFEIFHRRVHAFEVRGEQKLYEIAYCLSRNAILRATNNDQLLKIEDGEYLQQCFSSKFIDIVSLPKVEYPFTQGVLEIKVKIDKQKIPAKWALVDPIKFDVASKNIYELKQKPIYRSLNDPLTVSQIIESFSKPEQLTKDNAWYCNKCKDHKLAQKIMSVYRTAKYLILHLKRFNHSGNRYVIYGEKVKTPIKLKDYETINNKKYELFGVVNHYGNLNMGHYTAFVKREETWFYADDSSFKRREVDGDNAYLVFYKRAE